MSIQTLLGLAPKRANFADESSYLHACALFQIELGAVNYFEPDALVGLPYRRPHRVYKPDDVGLTPEVFELASRFGFEPLDFDLLLKHHPRQSILGSLWEAAGEPSALFVDPFYGVALAPKDGQLIAANFVLAYLVKYQKHLPKDVFREYVTRPAIVLDNGLELARQFLGGRISPAVDAQLEDMKTPEILVGSVDEYHDLLADLCGCFVGSNCQLWLRGQNQDFLEPDPAELLKDPTFLSYRQVRSSSLVPSLYRRADALWGTMEGLEAYTTSLDAWMRAAGTILGQTVTSRPSMNFESNSSWESPDHAGGPKMSVTRSTTNGEHLEVETRDFHFEHDYHRWSLLLQHYGCPTQYLDVTNNRDVALFLQLDGLRSTA